jgi:hypothetical protein
LIFAPAAGWALKTGSSRGIERNACARSAAFGSASGLRFAESLLMRSGSGSVR